MIFYIQPIPDVHTVAIKRDLLIIQCIEDDQRNEFFGKLARAVIIRRPRDDDRKSECLIIGEHQAVGRRLARRIRAGRVEHACLPEFPLENGSVNLVGGDLQECLDSVFERAIKQHANALKVGLYEWLGSINTTINMGLGGEVDDSIRSEAPEDLFHLGRIAYVCFDEMISLSRFKTLQVLKIARICQLIDVQDIMGRVFFGEIANEVGTDETAAAGY